MSYAFVSSSSQRFYITDGASNPVSLAVPFSVAVWWKRTAVSDGSDRVAVGFSQGSSGTGNDSQIRSRDGTGWSRPEGRVLAASTEVTPTGITGYNENTTGWHLVVWVVDGSGGNVSGQTVFYWRSDFDSMREWVSTGSYPLALATMDNLAIGAAFTNGINHWNGKIAEVSIWTRALDVDDATELKTKYATSISDQTGLYAYWPLFDSETQTAGSATLDALSNNGSPTADSADHPSLSSGASAVAGISRHYARMMNG